MIDSLSMIDGSEEGWAAATDPNDSRHDQKQKDIKATVDKLISNRKAKDDAGWDRFEDDLIEAAGPVVRAGLGRENSSVGYSRSYARNYDSVFKGDN